MNSARPVPTLLTKPERGFTLIELMVTTVVAAILLAIAAPSFTSIIATQRVKSAATDLYIALTQARSEALKRNTSITVATDGNWQDGWYVADPATAVRIYNHGALKNITISGSSVTYRSSGRVQGTTAPTFSVSATGTNTLMCVSVDLSGRPYQTITTTSASCS